MEDKTLLEKIQLLSPADLEMLELQVDILLQKAQALHPKQPRVFGFGKGILTYMADDFDAPLEEFEPYS